MSIPKWSTTPVKGFENLTTAGQPMAVPVNATDNPNSPKTLFFLNIGTTTVDPKAPTAPETSEYRSHASKQFFYSALWNVIAIPADLIARIARVVTFYDFFAGSKPFSQRSVDWLKNVGRIIASPFMAPIVIAACLYAAINPSAAARNFVITLENALYENHALDYLKPMTLDQLLAFTVTYKSPAQAEAQTSSNSASASSVSTLPSSSSASSSSSTSSHSATQSTSASSASTTPVTTSSPSSLTSPAASSSGSSSSAFSPVITVQSQKELRGAAKKARRAAKKLAKSWTLLEQTKPSAPNQRSVAKKPNKLVTPKSTPKGSTPKDLMAQKAEQLKIEALKRAVLQGFEASKKETNNIATKKPVVPLQTPKQGQSGATASAPSSSAVKASSSASSNQSIASSASTSMVEFGPMPLKAQDTNPPEIPSGYIALPDLLTRSIFYFNPNLLVPVAGKKDSTSLVSAIKNNTAPKEITGSSSSSSSPSTHISSSSTSTMSNPVRKVPLSTKPPTKQPSKKLGHTTQSAVPKTNTKETSTAWWQDDDTDVTPKRLRRSPNSLVDAAGRYKRTGEKYFGISEALIGSKANPQKT